jgi:hypothetical protein
MGMVLATSHSRRSYVVGFPQESDEGDVWTQEGGIVYVCLQVFALPSSERCDEMLG